MCVAPCSFHPRPMDHHTKRARLRVGLLLGVAFLATPVLAKSLPKVGKVSTNGSKPVHRVARTHLPIEIDGVLDEAAWAQAASIPLAYETKPGENIAPAAETECLITYDNGQLYVAFRAQDPEPGKIRARLADRDRAFSDDFVGIALDTFNDGRRAFQFFVNPRGVQMDSMMDDVNDNEDSSWDAIWSSAGRLTETGYIVELAVPFSSLRFPQTTGAQIWGVDILRNMPRDTRIRLANNPQDRDVDCYVCQFAKLEGFANISPGRNLEINPTITGGVLEEREDFPVSPLETADEVSDLGLTVRWGVTPNLNLSATFNPDFSQVEADVAQLEVNNQFALFFPERRPFFLEDADLFDTNLDTVFTRNVADPIWGLRTTGKAGKNAFGVFVAEDEITNLLFPGNQGSSADSFDFETTDAVLRYR
ncbi:MAG: sugar-binding protein, partial [Acidobacteriota bacterium]